MASLEPGEYETKVVYILFGRVISINSYDRLVIGKCVLFPSSLVRYVCPHFVVHQLVFVLSTEFNGFDTICRVHSYLFDFVSITDQVLFLTPTVVSSEDGWSQIVGKYNHNLLVLIVSPRSYRFEMNILREVPLHICMWPFEVYWAVMQFVW